MTLNEKRAGYAVNTVFVLAIVIGSVLLSQFGGETFRLKYSPIVWQCAEFLHIPPSVRPA